MATRALKRQVGGSQVFVAVVDPARIPEVVGLVTGVADGDATVDEPTRTVQAPAEGGPRVVSRLADALDAAGVEVEDLGLRQPTLDDVFLTLTGAPITEDDPVPPTPVEAAR